MSTTTVQEEEAQARTRYRNLEKARKARARNVERRRKEAVRAARQATSKERAAETRRRREEAAYAEAIEQSGAISVPSRDREIAEDHARRYQARTGESVEVFHLEGYGWTFREVV